MPKVKSRNVRIEEAKNGFIVRTEKHVELDPRPDKAEDVIYPRTDWQSEEHVAADKAEASRIAMDFLGGGDDG
jgi:hypothetical protein